MSFDYNQVKQVDYLTMEELSSLLNVTKRPRDKAIFYLLFFCGLRASEVGLILFDDINLKQKTIQIKRLKGSKGYIYDLDTRSMKLLKAHVDSKKYKKYLEEQEVLREPAHLFPSNKHKPISRTQVWRLVVTLQDLEHSLLHLFWHKLPTLKYVSRSVLVTPL